MLAETGTEFQEEAIRTREHMKALRASGKLMYGQVPMLEIDGLTIVQASSLTYSAIHEGTLNIFLKNPLIIFSARPRPFCTTSPGLPSPASLKGAHVGMLKAPLLMNFDPGPHTAPQPHDASFVFFTGNITCLVQRQRRGQRY